MNKVEVKDKLWKIIKEMLLTNLETKHEIPEIISDFILENHGWTMEAKLQPDSSADLNNFLKILQKWIEDTHLLLYDCSSETGGKVTSDLSGVFNRYLDAESEYSVVTSQLIGSLNEVMKHKEKYSQYFKHKCMVQENSVEVLSAKAHSLKLQSLLKHYSEGNALRSHLKLHYNLREELETLKKKYSEMLELNEKYEQIKNNKYFVELFETYKELRKIEKRAEIIGQL